jgi:DNA repair exonuclease SbcCD ATPase subunit
MVHKVTNREVVRWEDEDGVQRDFDTPRDISREWQEIHAERDALRAEVEALERKMKAHRETAVAAITGAEKQVDALRAEVERLTHLHNLDHSLADQREAENERLRAVVEAARTFVEQHQIGQPGTPGTLYPMTYGVQDKWHDEWDRRLAALIAACRT